jgi:hypothetical protein
MAALLHSADIGSLSRTMTLAGQQIDHYTHGIAEPRRF